MRERAPDLRVRPVGAVAALVEVPAGSAAGWRETLHSLVRRGLLPSPREIVPAESSVLVDGIPAEVVAAALAGVEPPEPAQDASGPVVEVPTVYDGADLDEVARLWGTDRQGVVDRHTGTELRVAFCGFAPGFPYLVGLPGELPRRPTPRTSVPAGAVALAGRYCGIYPTATPGGWQLVGRTGLRLFDPAADPPALLPPGTRVRFVAVRSLPEGDAPRRPPPDPPRERELVVVRSGALTTVQDLGRRGFAHLGVPRGGALDEPAARLANRLVGNPEAVAVLETTLDGVALAATAPVTVAVTGAPAAVAVEGRTVEWGTPVELAAGSVLEVGPPVTGVRSYVAVAGGVDVPELLGSRSADTLAGLGPAPLQDGVRLPVGEPPGHPVAVEFSVPARDGAVLLRLRAGPRDDRFDGAALRRLAGSAYVVSEASNRVGARLAGAALHRIDDAEHASEGMVLGAVQVPADGQPLVFLADHPTTGGYPVIGVVEPADLVALAQARPGTEVRFRLLRSRVEPQAEDA